MNPVKSCVIANAFVAGVMYQRGDGDWPLSAWCAFLFALFVIQRLRPSHP